VQQTTTIDLDHIGDDTQQSLERTKKNQIDPTKEQLLRHKILQFEADKNREIEQSLGTAQPHMSKGWQCGLQQDGNTVQSSCILAQRSLESQESKTQCSEVTA
jgi:hypothetical protein